MSYRTMKRLLGETSLERKCRFLFGGGLMLLITGSFYIYYRLTENLVFEKSRETAQMLVPTVVREKHWRSRDLFDASFANFNLLDGELPQEEYRWILVPAELDKAEPSKRPVNKMDYDAWQALREGAPDVTGHIRENDREDYYYYAPVLADRQCLQCHQDSGVAEGEMLGMVGIRFPLQKTRTELARNSAFLLTTAIVTAFLAMLAAYAIVRYVIVKPVLHLKDVSDEIARGNLDLRADIHTGDEFEELSQAFNRMLRHMMTVQDDLRELNTDLDGKVDQLAQVNLRLYEMNKLKDEFLATMSHELRTPLNSILGFSDVLASALNLDEKQKRYVDNIQSSGQALLALINDILDLAKIESGKMELQCTEFTAEDLVERQVSSLMPLAAKKHIELSSVVDPELPVLVQDAGKLQQILNNLLSNAIKFTPEGGRVRVRAQQWESEQLQLVVEDTGIGIPLEDQATIFEKFRQGSSIPGQEQTLTREYEGTGLGLSIVMELAKLLGGDVELQSEFGKGSTFSVTVPLDATPLAMQRRKDAQAPLAPAAAGAPGAAAAEAALRTASLQQEPTG